MMNVRRNAPYSCSRRWRMKFNRNRLSTVIGYRKDEPGTAEAPLTNPLPQIRVYYAHLKENFVYDEYDALYYNTDQTGTLRNICFREIPARIVTSEIGNGQDDYMPGKIVIDTQYDSQHYHGYIYDEDLVADPKVFLHVRSAVYAGQTPDKYYELVSLNMRARPAQNPFESTMQTPGDTTIADNETASYRESLVLTTPMAKFRRARLDIQTDQKMTTIRSLSVELVQFVRRSYG